MQPQTALNGYAAKILLCFIRIAMVSGIRTGSNRIIFIEIALGIQNVSFY